MGPIPIPEDNPLSDRELPTFSDEALDKAQELNNAGRTGEGWEVLANEGDEYADNAALFVEINEQLNNPFGPSTDSQKHLDNYIETARQNDNRPPHVQDIIASYKSLPNSKPPLLWVPSDWWTTGLGMHPDRSKENPLSFHDDYDPFLDPDDPSSFLDPGEDIVDNDGNSVINGLRPISDFDPDSTMKMVIHPIMILIHMPISIPEKRYTTGTTIKPSIPIHPAMGTTEVETGMAAEMAVAAESRSCWTWTETGWSWCHWRTRPRSTTLTETATASAWAGCRPTTGCLPTTRTGMGRSRAARSCRSWITYRVRARTLRAWRISTAIATVFWTPRTRSGAGSGCGGIWTRTGRAMRGSCRRLPRRGSRRSISRATVWSARSRVTEYSARGATSMQRAPGRSTTRRYATRSMAFARRRTGV